MKITHRQTDEKSIVCFEGELDHHEAGKAIEQLAGIIDFYPSKQLIVDLAGLSFMDSSGIAVLLNAYRSATATNKTFLVRNTPPHAMKIFSAAGLRKLIEFEGEDHAKSFK